MAELSPWIGVDADKTLFVYDHWHDIGHFGPPIPKMVARVKQHLDEGTEVRLFSARVSDPEWEPRGREAWERLSQQLFGTPLSATDKKDYGMILLYDDRAVQVQENTGELMIEVAVRQALRRRKYVEPA